MAFGTNTAEIKAVITAEDKASPTLKKFGGNAGSAFSALSTLVTGAAVVAFGKKSVEAFNESATALTQLDAVLKSTGGQAGVTRDQAIKLSKEIEKTTSFSDEAALSVENMALTFTKIHSDIFPQFTMAALNVATALNHGLKPSTEQVVDTTKMLGKAMEDPDAGLGALHRYGVNVEDLKKKFNDNMSVAEKQKLIIQELGTEFGGSATAQAKTFSGQVDQMKNKFNDLQESIGQTITEALTPIVKFLATNPGVVKAMTFTILGLATAFLAVKVAAGVSGALGAVKTFSAFISSGGAIASVVGYGAVLAGIAADAYLVVRAVQSVIGAFKALANTRKAVEADKASMANAHSQLLDLAAHGNAEQKARAKKALAAGYASGGNYPANQPMIVGERGPELLIPNTSGTVIPNNQLNKTQTINISINAGAYMGSQQDARRYAQMIISAMGDIASSKNKSVNQLLGIS